MTCFFFLPEVPILDVVVETDAVGAAELGQDLHNLFLLFWVDLVFAVMGSVVGTIEALATAPLGQRCILLFF
jgi:hypothetical protein